MIEPQAVTQAEFMMHAYASVAVALLSAVPAFLAYLQARRAKEHAAGAQEAAQSNRTIAVQNHAALTDQLNGRLDELLKMARENGYQHGMNDGISAERARKQHQGGL